MKLPPGASEYAVQTGDTVVDIAYQFDVPTCNVVTTDGKLPDPFNLHPGQHLIILPRSTDPPTTHHVVAGESLRVTAHQYVSMQKYTAAIEAANPNVDCSDLYPGQLIMLPSIHEM
jgi:LysM repeat protein